MIPFGTVGGDHWKVTLVMLRTLVSCCGGSSGAAKINNIYRQKIKLQKYTAPISTSTSNDNRL